tara:strand:+ start:150 stop:296 length:147 start_codon:yes stop_codon:yes gene_type:complete
MEVLLIPPNTFFKVIDRVTDEAVKKIQLPKNLATWDLSGLDVYTLEEF